MSLAAPFSSLPLSTAPRVVADAGDFTPMLCLANSFKSGGRCVAGLDWAGGAAGGWLRPVLAGRGDGCLPEERMSDGSPLRPGDIVGVPFLREVPHLHQTENRLVRPGVPWKPLGRLDWLSLAELVDEPGEAMWGSGWHACNDRVPPDRVRPVEGSLRFIRVDRLWLRHRHGFDGNRRVKAAFHYAGESYCLSVTDPALIYATRGHAQGVGECGEALLCVSLTQPFNGYCFKLAASVLTRAGGYGSPS